MIDSIAGKSCVLCLEGFESNVNVSLGACCFKLRVLHKWRGHPNEGMELAG